MLQRSKARVPRGPKLGQADNKRRNRALLYAFRGVRAMVWVSPILTVFMNDLGLSDFQMLLIPALGCGMLVLANVPAGYIADHWSYRKSLIVGALLIALGYSCNALAASFWWILAAELGIAIGLSFILSAQSALGYANLSGPPQQRGQQCIRFEGLSILYEGGAQAFASLMCIVGLLALGLEHRQMFWVQVGIMLCMVPLALAMKESDQQKVRIKTPNPVREMARVVRFALRDHPELKWLIAYGAVVVTMAHCSVFLVFLYYLRVGFDRDWFGLPWAGQMLAWALFALGARWFEQRFGKRRALVLLLAVGVVTYALAGAIQSVWLIPALTGFAFVRAMAAPLVISYINGHISNAQRATVLALQDLMQKLLLLVLAPCLGAVSSWLGLGAAMWTAAGFFLVTGASVLYKMWRAKIL